MPFIKATAEVLPRDKGKVTYYDIDGSKEIRISSFIQGPAWRNLVCS